jgi:hypothetical protein
MYECKVCNRTFEENERICVASCTESVCDDCMKPRECVSCSDWGDQWICPSHDEKWEVCDGCGAKSCEDCNAEGSAPQKCDGCDTRFCEDCKEYNLTDCKLCDESVCVDCNGSHRH